MSYDVVVVGGGHNGLVCSYYLAKVGLKVRVLERRSVVGGAAVTEEFHPGFRNSVASYTVSLLNPKVIRDMDLARHGLKVVLRPISNFLPTEDGRYLKMGGGLAKTQAEIAKFSKRDAEQLPIYQSRLQEIADFLADLTLKTPPNPAKKLQAGWAALKQLWPAAKGSMPYQQELLDLFTKSAADYLGQYFESDPVQAVFGFDAVVGNFASPATPGSAYVLLHHVFGEVNGEKGAWGHAIGGMGAITQAMRKACQEAGVEISVDASVAALNVHAGKAVGVTLESGEEVAGKRIVSNLNPKLFFTKMVDENDLDDRFLSRMKAWRGGSGTFRMNVALSELPDFTCLPGKELAEHHQSGIIIAPSLAYMDRAYTDAKYHGWSQKPIVEMVISSTLDDTLAPEGKYVASLFCQHVSPTLPNGEEWSNHRDTVADLMIDTVNEYAPNFKASVLGRMALTPQDLEEKFGLVAGDIFHGAMTLDQVWAARPALGHGDYRAPIGNLYMCGSGTHPGGGVTGMPGHNAAREILKDTRRKGLPMAG